MLIDAPFGIGRDGRTATTDEIGHIRDMIEAVLLTRPGDRVNRPEFGCDVHRLTYAPASFDSAAALQASIHAVLQQWLGDIIDVDNVEVAIADSKLQATIAFRVRQTGVASDHMVEVPAA